MTTMWYAAQSFLDGFTSMTSIFSPALRPGSEEPLFLSDSPADQTIMEDVENFLREVEPLILNEETAHRKSLILSTKVRQTRNALAASQSGT